MLSAVIITQNEERNIYRCLSSLEDIADEIIVVDSGSSDATEAICRSHGATFVHHDWEGFSLQKNYADTLAQGEWILSVDADEALSPALRQELLSLKQRGFEHGCAYKFSRLTNFCGSWIHHCGWYPDAKVRLFECGTAQWVGAFHERIDFQPQPRIVSLHADLLHYSYYTTDEFLSRQAKYARLGGEEAYRRGKHCSGVALVAKTVWAFLRSYLLHRGFLDGSAGLRVCRMNGRYTYMKYSTLRQLSKQSSSCPK